MVAALQGAQQSAMSSSMGRMQGEMMRSANELQQLAREQQELLVDTEAANRRALTEREKELKDKLERFMAKAKTELGKMAEAFPDVEGGGPPRDNALDDATVNNLVKEMIARLGQKDFSGFDQIMDMAQQELSKSRTRQQESKASQAQAGLKDLKSELDQLLGIPPTALKDTEKSGIRDLERRQGTLKERTQQLNDKLESLFQLFPSLDPQITKNIKEAGGSMGQAQGKLGELDSKNAVPPERRALEQLSQSQQQMQSAMQQLAQRGQLGRMAVSRLFRMGRMLPSGELVPLPGMPQFPQFDVEGGMTGLDTEKFRLPGKEDYRAPRSFREEILESMKQGVPRQMKEQIESYFKNLSE
jgi:DNA repair exonuclease SbcCD ATPase subunit